MKTCRLLLLLLCAAAGSAGAQYPGNLADLGVAKLQCENALWVENPIEKQFLSDTRVVVANPTACPATARIDPTRLATRQAPRSGPLYLEEATQSSPG
jgi:hypothetical protein